VEAPLQYLCHGIHRFCKCCGIQLGTPAIRILAREPVKNGKGVRFGQHSNLEVKALKTDALNLCNLAYLRTPSAPRQQSYGRQELQSSS